jgi:hypothetical protein
MLELLAPAGSERDGRKIGARSEGRKFGARSVVPLWPDDRDERYDTG